MKNKFAILLSAGLISVSVVAQKDELKTLKKIYDKEQPSAKDVMEYKAAVDKAETLVANSTEADKIYFEFYKANIPFVEMSEGMAKPENQKDPQFAMKFFNTQNIDKLATAMNAVLDYEKKSGKQIYTSDIKESVMTIKPVLENYVYALDKQKKYGDISSIMHSLYLMDKTDGEKLYYAAGYAYMAQDYDTALNYYMELKKINYSGEKTLYYAKNNASGTEEYFTTKEQRDSFINNLKTHTSPREEKVPSKRGEIYKNIALILIDRGRTEEAKGAIAEARTNNPDDASLIVEEANLYLKLKDMATYTKLIGQALEKSPNNADLVYNLGVVTAPTDAVQAEKYYKRAIEIDPKYVNAYVNLAIMKLSGEQKLTDEMNKLTNSDKDSKRYMVLKKQREDMYREAMPYLEKGFDLDPSNDGVAKTLSGIYGALEMTEKREALKKRMAK